MHAVKGHVVEIEGLSRRFRRTLALDKVSLVVPCGGVYGLVGENGAGKTTLIKHLLGLFRAQKGSVQVFGLDPVHHPEAVLGRIGYLSEDRDLPGWMRVEELMRYTQRFYPSWDEAYAEDLRRTFDLDPKAKIRTLSRGQLAKAGLLVALAHRPDLLLLDEPSSGLDVIVRRDILSAIIRTVADEGRTVIFSSHLLNEVERVVDRVAMIYRGKLGFDAPLETIKESHHRIVLHFGNGRSAPPDLPGTISCQGAGKEWTVIVEGTREHAQAQAAQSGGELVEIATPSLEDVFVAHATQGVPAGEV